MAPLDLQCSKTVRDLLHAGAESNRSAPCRQGSIDVVRAPGRLVASGDLHDNPVSFASLVHAANLGVAPGVVGDTADDGGEQGPAHLTLHEMIHAEPEPHHAPDRPDTSYRALARIAALKLHHPGHVHTLLANHELAQIFDSEITKRGVRVVQQFNKGVEMVFGDDAPLIFHAIDDFVRSMPLALRCECPQGDILCAHSLPGPAMMTRFDTTILSRELTDDDYSPITGSAFMMVWGRDHDAELLEDLTEAWGVNLFILGHEHTPEGHKLIEPNALVLSSDHHHGVYLPVDLSHKPRLEQCPEMLVRVSDHQSD